MMGKPKIRFKGYNEDWEQRKLGDLVNRVSRKNQDLVSELPLTISAQYGLIDQNEFFNKRVASKDISGYYLIENGEFAYNKSTSTDAPWGTIKRLDRYENGVLSTLYIVFGIKENNPVDSDFLVSYYSTNLWHKGIHEIAAEGARNHGLLNISPMDFFETKLMIPQDIEEQKKIGKYFEELERLITLHQHKCDEMKKLKKCMLQKMFPKNGKKVPEIRFDGFTNDWEQRKLGEMATFINGRAYSQDELLNSGKYKVLRVGNFYTNDSWYYSDMELDDKYYAENGDLLYTWSATFGPHIWHGNKVIYHYHIWKIELSKALEKNFALQLLERDKQAILSDKNGSTMVHITKAGMEGKEVLLPTNIVEQVKIGEYFTNLDHLITLHQHKCDELQNLKKYMLQNMFV